MLLYMKLGAMITVLSNSLKKTSASTTKVTMQKSCTTQIILDPSQVPGNSYCITNSHI
jgi:hypothetical protein